MSRHWNPDEELADRACRQHALDRELADQHALDRELARSIAAEELALAGKKWPEGATAGLLLVALSCIAFGALLYQVTGPRTVVEDSAARR
ncbi:MAG TPA: hypothetical protein VFO12_11710 [Sphingomicrobium sp.]|nr:hypothetical protein [Sphingomicrobium sp.]